MLLDFQGAFGMDLLGHAATQSSTDGLFTLWRNTFNDKNDTTAPPTSPFTMQVPKQTDTSLWPVLTYLRHKGTK